MFCLELSIPPLPKLLTVNKVTFWRNDVHPERVFPLYDIIIVRHGVFYITEEDTPYELKENQMIILEPGKRHYGHQPCSTDTLLFYLHFQHKAPLQTLPIENIQWNAVMPLTTYHDLEVQEQKMYIPKSIELNVKQYEPILEEMITLREQSIMENMLPLQANLAQFLAMLQKTARSQSLARSEQVCNLITNYLYTTMEQPFRLEDMAQDLNFSINYLSKCLKKHTGLTPLHYLNHIRMEKAVALLSHTNLTLQEISMKVGIPDYNYFFRLFRKHAGIPPAKFRSEVYASKTT
ncbi:AraC family transcriptional regulator [Paenibacillus filicis]|uniref:AraC family transcriptional regulator n=1 Tax=Paenibacillus gyeongsangnamensis TaxID=3388067 RepID=A0ABT4Q273_9BACL|nr:AraC family transcriptional regulator [Paenibacillus filicis]MCZ8510971.1 AraC family transcriptional regulator [Paenibacillus filicis]